MVRLHSLAFPDKAGAKIEMNAKVKYEDKTEEFDESLFIFAIDSSISLQDVSK